MIKEKATKAATKQKKAVLPVEPSPVKTVVRTVEAQRKDALRYYLIGLNLAEISLLLGGVSVRSLERWQQEDKWTSAKNPKASPIKERIAEMHKTGTSLNAIAQKVGVSKTTVHRYIKDLEAAPLSISDNG